MFGGNDNSQAQQPTDMPEPAAQVQDPAVAQNVGDPSSPPPVVEPTNLPSPHPDEVATGYSEGDQPAVGGVQLPAAADGSAQTPLSVDDMLGIKQGALQQLAPLISHLDQAPEEKFRTTMMMIQASDNDSLLKSAYESAQQITDEKTRAQALLDVVNEINYFTQHNGDSTPQN